MICLQVDVACRAFHQEALDDGVDADDSSTEGDDGVSPKEVRVVKKEYDQ